MNEEFAPSASSSWPNWGRPDVSGPARIAPFDSVVELTAAIVEITSVADHPEGFGGELRRLLSAFEQRLEVTPPTQFAYLRARQAWSLSPIAWWFLAATIGWELVPQSTRAPAPTIGSCARIATTLAGDHLRWLDGMAVAAPGGELARLDLITVLGDGAFYSRGVRAVPRVLELALADASAGPHLELVRTGLPVMTAVAAADGDLLERIGAALVDRSPIQLADDDVIPAILHVADALGIPVLVARAHDAPAVVVREALLAGAAIVLAGAPLAHPAWALHRHALLIVNCSARSCFELNS